MCPVAEPKTKGMRGDAQCRQHARRHRQRINVAPALETLEGRRLLSIYTGPSAVKNILSSGGVFRIQVEGPGLIKVHSAGNGAIDLSAFGTTPVTTLSVTQVRPRWHFPTQLLTIHKLTITSGQLGTLDASAAQLTGTMTPLSNSMANFSIGQLGPAARVQVVGSVDMMNVSNINLGPEGLVSISGGLNTNDLTGSMTIGSVNLDGGRIMIGQDSVAPISVQDTMTISHDGLFSIGRDLDGSLTVNGNLVFDSGGELKVGRNLENLTVNGNLIVNPTGSGIVVNGVLGGLTVDGLFQGQGGTAAPTLFDLGVGLNANGLSILGGNTSQNGLINANIRGGKYQRSQHRLRDGQQHDSAEHAAAGVSAGSDAGRNAICGETPPWTGKRVRPLPSRLRCLCRH